MKKYLAAYLIFATATGYAQDGKLKVVRDTTQSITNTIQSLDDVDVVYRVEKTKMNGDVLVTRLVGTPLSNAGTAADALARVPGLFRRNGEIEVIGKGSPIYYINGRKINDPSELQRLSSQEIKEVEVIQHPGSQYDAQVNAVVRIKTVRRSGNSLGGSIDFKDIYGFQYGDNRDFSNLNLNYRHNNLELFGGAAYEDFNLEHYKTDISQTTIAHNIVQQQGNSDMSQRYDNLRYHLGGDWQITDKNSLGFRMERNDNLQGITDYTMNGDIFSDKQIDQLRTKTHTDAHGVDSWAANTYYMGEVGKWQLNWNFDYYHTSEDSRAVSDETAWSGNRTVDANSASTNNLYATKLIVTYPLRRGKMNFGTEIVLMDRDNTYDIDQQQIADAHTQVDERTYAAFAEYSAMIPIGMLSLGLRYERVDFEYKSLFDASQNLSRIQNHLYPNISFASQLGEVQGSISYAVKTRRPSFRDLRSNIEYNNRYCLSTGNAQLKNEINQQAGIHLHWRYLNLGLDYQCQKEGIYDWSNPYDDNGTVLISWTNLDKPLNSLGAFVNVTNTLGKWSPNYTVVLQKQWLSFDLADPREASGMRTVKYNKPMFIFNANNAWRIPSHNDDGFGAWQLELNSEFMSGFHYGNAEVRNCFWNLSMGVQKSWLENDALSLRLDVYDIFRTAHHNVRIDLGNYILTQTHINGVERSVYDPQTIALSLRYKFNARTNKYKGTGAGNDVKSRM